MGTPSHIHMRMCSHILEKCTIITTRNTGQTVTSVVPRPVRQR